MLDRLRLRSFFPLSAALCAAVSLACGDLTLPSGALWGEWASPEVALVLTADGGTLDYACGAGTIGAGWQLADDGNFRGTGEHRFGGGPEPDTGRPAYRAEYTGALRRGRLTLTVQLPDLDQRLGPFELQRGRKIVGPICL